MHHLVLILFKLINTTQQPTVEPTMRYHDTVVKTTDSIVQKVPTATPHPIDLFHNMLVTFANVQLAI
jgi:hypothetical protein